jgi:hypothetical protein
MVGTESNSADMATWREEVDLRLEDMSNQVLELERKQSILDLKL